MQKYRPDIDGLRAMAVVPVVLFHAGASPFGGGYVGVDVFFVISGFLITSIIAGELAADRVSLGGFLASFYERRVRRIFPALFAVVLVTALLCAVVLLPRDFQDFSQSVAATVLFASNMLFWQEAGYFDGPAHYKPLLHTWSLAVEEQFYIVFPLALLALFRWAPRATRPVVAGIAVATFAASVWVVERAPDAAFYLAPLRAWELMLGALLALGAVPALRGRWPREFAALAGLGLIVWSVLTYTDKTRFPGVAALAPCLGAALVIYAGTAGQSLVGRLLSLRPMVFIGLISYSLYLWHWPLLVIARYWRFDPLSPVETAGIVGLSVLAAVLSWRFVEQPFRRRRAGAGARNALFAGAAGVSLAIFAFGLFGHLSNGWPGRLAPEVVALEAGRLDNNPQRRKCHADNGNRTTYAQKCVYGAAGVPPRFAIWGDSHATELAPVLGQLAAAAGASIRHVSYSSCPPALEFAARPAPLCARHNAEILSSMIADPVLDTVFLVARYPFAYRVWGEPFFDEFEKVVRELERAGKTVVIVYPVPEYPFSVPVRLAMLARAGGDLEAVGMARSSFDRDYAVLFDRLDRIVDETGAERVYPSQKICGDRVCRVLSGGRPLYFNDDHLSMAGARYVAPLFEPFFTAPLRAEAPNG